MRVRELEEAFRSRYNRVVTIDRQTVIQDNRVVTCTITIESGVKKFVLIEHLTEDGLTDNVDVKFCDKSWNFKKHLEAEVFVADKIGEN